MRSCLKSSWAWINPVASLQPSSFAGVCESRHVEGS